MEMFLFILEIIGTIAFAVGGAVLAVKNKLDILGVIILAIIAALGGGVIRDITLSKTIVLFEYPVYLIIAVITSLIVFILFYYTKKTNLFENVIFNNILNVIDAIGLGVFVVIGYNVASLCTDNILLMVFSGLITGLGGGILRDLLVNRIPNIFRKHIYGLAALIGLCIYMLFVHLGNEVSGTILCIVFVTLIRIVSQIFKLSLPKVSI